MVASGYIVDRALGLCLSLVCVLLSLSQLFLYQYLKAKHKQKKGHADNSSSQAKHYIHYTNLVLVVAIFINFIDPFGVFGMIPFLAQNLSLNLFGTKGMQASLCLIIHSHFAAHYRALKMEIPASYAWFLFANWSLSFVGTLCGFLLAERVPSLFILTDVFAIYWLIAILLIDVYGYYLVRKLILDLKSPKSFVVPSVQPSGESLADRGQEVHQRQGTGRPNTRRSSSAYYSDFMSRLRRFHGILTIATFAYVLLIIYFLSSNSSKGSIQPPNPEKFSAGNASIFLPFTYLLIWSFFTWWAWIPFLTDSEVDSKNSTYLSRDQDKSTKKTNNASRSGGEILEVPNEEIGMSGNGLPSPSKTDSGASAAGEAPESPSLRATPFRAGESMGSSSDLESEINSQEGIILVTISKEGQLMPQ